MFICELLCRPTLNGVGGHGCRSRTIRRLLAVVVCGMLAGGAALANPSGPTVAHGTVQFARPGANTLDITASSNAIINWQGFSVDAGETTRFIQPTATSAVLNRVTGSDPSSILGQLASNGRVFLVNPHGIVFGEDAVVDTAGLVASTLGIDDADFLAGRYEFDAGPDAGDIENLGLIESGADGVFLLAPSVENSGVIRTDGGDLVLAAGRTITLTSLDLDGVRVEVQAPEDGALNLGELIANRGAAGVFAHSIRNSGTVEANAVTVDENGTIRLVAQGDITLEASGRVAADGPSGGEVHIESKSGTTWVSGEVSAQGSEGQGGTIRLLGQQVGLEDAQVDASGTDGGGEVLVGGDESGEGSVPTAESIYVSADSTVSADALEDGDGGKVVVFAEGFANVLGQLSARGGPDGGDGGFVETSGLKSFAIALTPDTTAPNGDGGDWLIDPNDIEIVPGGGAANIGDSNPFTSTNDNARLGIDLLIAALSGGQTVTVQTTESGESNQGGDITLNAALDVEETTGTNTLIFDAHRDIIINERISDTAAGSVLNLVFGAGEDVEIYADVTLVDGLLRTEGDFVAIGSGATVTLDSVDWDMNNRALGIGSDHSGRTSIGTVIVRNDATIDATDKLFIVGDGATGTGTLRIEGGADLTAARFIVGYRPGWVGTVAVTGSGSTLTTTGIDNEILVGHHGTGTLSILEGADVTARRVIIANAAGSRGTMTVTGAGSTLTTVGTDNEVFVGNRGTGTLHVLDGGLVDTLKFHLAWWGEGRVVIGGVSANGMRSRVIVSAANGRFSDTPSEGAFARVARNDGSIAHLEILEGGLLRVLDTDDTFGPGFHLARNKGSVGTLLIDGENSSLEVIQEGPAGEYGPHVALGRRGRGVATIRNGGRLLLQGERASLDVSRDSVNPDFPDADTGSIDEHSTVNIHSGGRLEVSGERAHLIVGNAGPAADGEVIATGRGSMIIVSGDGNRLVVGDDGARGLVEVRDGAAARFGELVVGPNGSTNLSVSELAQREINEIVGEILPDEESQGEEDEDDDDGESTAEAGDGEEEEQEELQMCPS